jgi:hypothetical protein
MDNNMEEKTYNGWSNYETWAAGLWIDNEQGSHSYWREQAAKHFENAAESEAPHESLWSQRSAARSKLAEQIQEEFEEASPLADQASVYSDLLTAALGEVDWHEIADHLLNDTIGEDEEEQIEDPALTVIFAYTRAQAIEDGVLVDVSEMANEAGFTMPVAITVAAWRMYVRAPDGVEHQDEQGRLWDVLNMLRFAIKKGGQGSELLFTVSINNDGEPKPVQLKSICGPGDDAKPVVTIMLPRED